MGSGTSELGPLIGWIFAIAGFWIAIFVHELGHAAAALACRWKVAVFVAGPIGFHFVNREFAWVPRSKRFEFAGFVVPNPRSATVWTRARAVIVHAGGPAASLLLAIVLAIASRLWPSPTRIGEFDAAQIAAGLGLFTVGTAFMTLTPNAPGKHPSDGQNIVRSLRTPKSEWLKMRSLTRLYALAKHGVRLRDLPLWMLEEAQAATCGIDNLEAAVAALVIGIVLDSPPVDAESARALIEEFRRVNGDNAWLACCDVYLSAVWENDAARGRALLWKEPVEADLKPLALAVEAAVLVKEGDHSKAKQLLLEMKSAAARQSAFTDLTIRDIGRQIEILMRSNS